ncbi:MAG: rane-associated zinc metalloprotease [bacterium]|nr:rane-associated zinc metalloprotease [bacterium]
MDLLATPGTILLAILALGILIIVHEGGHFLVARLSGMRVDRFSIGFGPKLFSFKRGETVYQIAAIPLGGFVQIAGLNPGEEGMAANDPRAYPNRPVWQRLATIFAGPATNYIFAALMLIAIFLAWGVPGLGKAPVVDEVVANSAAQAAGLQAEDEILALDGKKVDDGNQVLPLVNASQGRPIVVDVVRNGKPVKVTVTPMKNGSSGYLMGVKLGGVQTWEQVSNGDRVKEALTYPFRYSAFVLQTLVTGGVKQIWQQGSGPAGIVGEIKKRIEHGPKQAFMIIAMISIYLGLFNLLPLPGLDGGRLMFLGWEAVSRRRVNERIEQTIHMVGVLMLLGLIAVITVKNDIPWHHWFGR